MPLTDGDLVLCSGTVPRDIPFRARVDAAAAAGFAGISLWGRDYMRARSEGLHDADIRAVLAHAGVEVGELDPAWWWPPGAEATGRSLPSELDTEEVFPLR